VTYLRATTVLALAAMLHCAEPSPPADDGGHLRIDVAPLSLPGVTNASYRLTVENSAGDVVWTRDVTSSGYGSGDGDLSYIGPCDADAAPARVELELLSLSAGAATLTAGVDYINPAPEGSPVAQTDVACLPNADVPVTFDLTVMRRAQQGFFDVAVTFDEIFCSAKLDCENDGADLELLHNPVSGARDTSIVLAFACTTGESSDTTLLMDDVVISCTSGTSPDPIDVAAGPGNLNPPYPGPEPDAARLLYQAAVFRGSESLGAYNKAYWNVTMGLNRDAFANLGTCTLSTRATAVDGPPATPGATPAGTTWPLVTWTAPIVASGDLACSHYGLDDDDGVVGTGYTPTTGATFGNAFRRSTGDVTSITPGSCGTDLECPSGTFCDVADLDGDSDTSECLPQRAAGLPCTSGRDQECQSGLVCDGGFCCDGDCSGSVGDGGDGALTLTSGTYDGAASGDMEARRVATASGADVTLTAAGGFSPGDELLAVVLQGPLGDVSKVGAWELHRVVTASGTDLTLDAPLGFGLDAAGLSAHVVFLQRVPHYSAVDVGSSATLTTTSYTSGGTGIVAFRSAGPVTVDGTITADGAGWRGKGPVSNSRHGPAGDSLAAAPSPATAPGQANYGGGGGGVSDCDATNCTSQSVGAGGGGGGYGTAGTAGANNGGLHVGGSGGQTYGDACMTSFFLGSGGGAGAGGVSGPGTGTSGGDGGGMVFISAPSIAVTGSVRARGELGSTNDNCGSNGGGGGGGGSGGTILLTASALQIVAGGVVATGNTARCNGGGTGGHGRVQLRFDTLNGDALGSAAATSSLASVAIPAAGCPVAGTP